MTHEFKTPLSSILIASNYLVKQKPILEDQKLHNYTDIIINQSNKLNQHIEKILTIAKSDYTPLELKKEPIAVVPVLEIAIENILLKYPDSSITIQTNAADTSIIADAFHFTNLVYNLLDNAVKYCDDKPEINIRLSKENQVVKLEFIDNGIGISNKNLSFIFDKFYRIPTQKSNEVNGFGLGLYYVKKICNLHHWKISAANNPEKGITITILIPTK
jgi:two-component system phosphate regulon sensor histidine kinase PhoR